MFKKENNGYVISRIINNNVITSHSDEAELVLMGKGISFQKRVGDYIEKERIEKTFVLKGKEKSRYLDIIENIPSEYIDLAIDILDIAEKKLDVKANPIGSIMLADHIDSAIGRAKKNIPLKNQMLSEIKRFYPLEFSIGKEAVVIVKEKFNVQLPVDEAGFIAFHIMNLSGNSLNDNSDEKIKLINKIIDVIEEYFGVRLNQDSIYYERFLTHLKYFSSRVFSDSAESKEHDEKNDFVYRMMKVQYPEITKSVELVSEYLNYNYGIIVSDEEKGYLSIHINNLLVKSKIVTEEG